MSGNHSAASGDTNVKTAAGTSPLINRLIALVCPSLSWTSPAPAAAIAVRTLSLDADCLSSIAMFLLARSETDLISGRAIRRATRRSVSFGGATAVFSAVFAFGSGAATAAAAVTCSASAVAAATCSRIVLALELAAATPAGRESGTFAGALPDPAAALPAVSNRACTERGESGTRKILKPANWGNPVSGYTKVSTAAGTSPAINRSIALVCPSLS